jgi:hypothetical protein
MEFEMRAIVTSKEALLEALRETLENVEEGVSMQSTRDGENYFHWIFREKALNPVHFIRDWNCHFHKACLPDEYPTEHNASWRNLTVARGLALNPVGMDHVCCSGCKGQITLLPATPCKGHAPSYVEVKE